ncbi:hypothetical protein D9M68_607840 [compost metagenome]
MAAHALLGERQQGLGDQLRAEEGAADADVDHVGDGSLGVAAPQAVVHIAHQLGHLVQYAVHLGHHVDALDPDLVADGPAQGGVQHRAPLGGVDHLATEHRLDGRVQLRFLGQPDQQGQAVGADQVLREVQQQAAGAEAEVLEALGVVDEGLAQAEAVQILAVLLQGGPARQLGDIERRQVVIHGVPVCDL